MYYTCINILYIYITNNVIYLRFLSYGSWYLLTVTNKKIAKGNYTYIARRNFSLDLASKFLKFPHP